MEVLVSAVIISVLIMVAFAVLDVGRGSWFGGDVRAELRKEMIRAFMAMERELRETSPAQQSVSYDTSSTSITFRVPQDIDGDGTILDSFGYIEWPSLANSIVYSLNGNNEIIRTASGVTRVLARGITGLQFSRNRNPALPLELLIINITAQKASSVGKIATETGQLIVKMRN